MKYGGLVLIGIILATRGTGFSQGIPERPTRFQGICDASAVVALDEDLVAVADDEDNAIRVYSARHGGNPLSETDLTTFLRIPPKAGEADLEAAARLGDHIFWISSHGCNAKGKAEQNRQQFFATKSSMGAGTVRMQLVGQPCHTLLAALIRDPKLARFNLARAVNLAPKEFGALNIEGLAATPDGRLLIGFRNPIPDGKALLVPLLNPNELLAGQPAQFGDPLLLNLQGLGIRSITEWEGRFLIIAGRYDGGGQSRLFEWPGGSEQPRPVSRFEFSGFNPEAITLLPRQDGPAPLFVTSDDGTLEIGGKPCKKLKNAQQKSFRAMIMAAP